MLLTPDRQQRIAVAGAAGVDLTLRCASQWIGDIGRDEFTPDSMHPLKDPVECGLGGNGGASAFVLGTLGLQVELNAPIGRDPFGELTRKWLAEANVRCIAPPTDSTSISITAVDAEGKRLGTLRHAGPRVDWTLSARKLTADWLLLAVHSRVTVEELTIVHKTLELARKAGSTTVLDTGIGWFGTAERRLVHGLWSNADYVIGTFEELAMWTGQDDPQAIADKVRACGVRTIVIKMGSAGASYTGRAGCLIHQSSCGINKPNLSVGAGDAFNGAFIAAMAFGNTLAQAVRRAQRVAATVVAEGRGVLGWRNSVECDRRHFGVRSAGSDS